MYAILQQSGHQYRVSPGDRLVVDRLAAEVGSVVALEPVVLVASDDGTQVGTPVVDGVRVAAVVVSHRRGAKIRVFKYKPKKHYRRTHGHRSSLTELRVEAVLAAGEPLPKPKAAEKKKAAPAAEAPAAEKPVRSRSRAKAPAAEAPATEAAEAPEAWGTGEAPEATTDAATEAAADTVAEAPTPKKRAPRTRAKKDVPDPDDTAADSGDSES
ncbi:MAG TPA: 50S ribosomal protein L21 [Candidatus Dormibacteraeota bacterium]|nr:50S ribosomal protein L21 [Candidatus Dormibacteraeota bacterium]